MVHFEFDRALLEVDYGGFDLVYFYVFQGVDFNSLDYVFIAFLIESLPRDKDNSRYGFIEIYIRGIFEHLIDQIKRRRHAHNIDKEGLSKSRELLLQIFDNLIDLFLLYLLYQHFVHINDHLQLMIQNIILLHFLNLQVLRKQLFNEPSHYEIAIHFIAKAEQKVHHIDQLIIERHFFEIRIDADDGIRHFLFDRVIINLINQSTCELPHRVVLPCTKLTKNRVAFALETNDITIRCEYLFVILIEDLIIANLLFVELLEPLIREDRILTKDQPILYYVITNDIFLFDTDTTTFVNRAMPLCLIYFNPFWCTLFTYVSMTSLAKMLYVDQHLKFTITDLTFLSHFLVSLSSYGFDHPFVMCSLPDYQYDKIQYKSTLVRPMLYI